MGKGQSKQKVAQAKVHQPASIPEVLLSQKWKSFFKAFLISLDESTEVEDKWVEAVRKVFIEESESEEDGLFLQADMEIYRRKENNMVLNQTELEKGLWEIIEHGSTTMKRKESELTMSNASMEKEKSLTRSLRGSSDNISIPSILQESRWEERDVNVGEIIIPFLIRGPSSAVPLETKNIQEFVSVAACND